MNVKKFGQPYIRIVFLLGKIDVDVEARIVTISVITTKGGNENENLQIRNFGSWS